MFDLATRIRDTAASAGALAGVPFDLALLPPLPARAYAYTSFATTTALPETHTQVLATYALELEGTLATAVMLSLFADARASADDALPMGQQDRRGWMGDAYMPAADAGAGQAGQDSMGSLLWLLYTGKATADVLPLARLYATEALAWLVRDGIASRVDVTAQWVGGTQGRMERLAVRPTIWQPDRVRPVYDVLWGTTLQRWAN